MDSIDQQRIYEVYLIFNHWNWKMYVGQTCAGHLTRWKQHIYIASTASKTSLSRAIRKYGDSSFTCLLLEDGLTQSEASITEKKWILDLQTHCSSVGYNLTLGGENGERTAEARMKMSLAKRGKPPSFLSGPNREAALLKSKLNKIKPLPVESIIFSYQSGSSIKELGDKYEVSPATIQSRLSKAGVSFRTLSEAQVIKTLKYPAIKGHTWNLGSRRTEEQKITMKEASGVRRKDVCDNEIVSLYESGKGSVYIAQKFRMTASGILYRLKQAGVSIRTEKGRKLYG